MSSFVSLLVELGVICASTHFSKAKCSFHFCQVVYLIVMSLESASSSSDLLLDDVVGHFLGATGKGVCPSQDSRAFNRRSFSPITDSSTAVGCIGLGLVEQMGGGCCISAGGL